jgi:hypothetical protein
MNIAKKAFLQLFEKEPKKDLSISYSGKFRDYNANVKYTSHSMHFNLSKKWEEISDEIQIGLIQHLLNRVHKKKNKTLNIELYESFMKNISDYAEVSHVNPVLEESFERMNEKHFLGMLDMPNLKWGRNSFHKLGCYDYGSNTITISTVLEEDQLLLDFVMFHEMIHKKLKFKSSGSRTHYHTKEFREKEKEYGVPDIEEKLEKFLRKKKREEFFKVKKKKKTKRSLIDWFFD